MEGVFFFFLMTLPILNLFFYFPLHHSHCSPPLQYNINESKETCLSCHLVCLFCLFLVIYMLLQEFSPSILKECISLGTLYTLERYRMEEISSYFRGESMASSLSTDVTYEPLFQAAQLMLFRHINSVINMLPVPHQVGMSESIFLLLRLQVFSLLCFFFSLLQGQRHIRDEVGDCLGC